MRNSNIPTPPESRRLAAVVFTDVVDYSARMQRDERATIAQVQADFDRMRSLCVEHDGEVLNTMGDGMLMSFGSAVQAVSCALQIQKEFGARKLALPEDHALEHRIGVHLGDVFRTREGQVAGDGVNIAARLEGKALPGGICLSQMVYETVKGKVPMQTHFAGPQVLKNIAEPMSVWHVMPEGMGGFVSTDLAASFGRSNRTIYKRSLVSVTTTILILAIAGIWYWTHRTDSLDHVAATDDKSIAVLPFTNMSDDKGTGYFADGVQEDLLTQLASVGELKVVSRTSVEEYRNSTKNMRQIGTELKVRFLIEGSVRRAGDQVRVTAQLIDARTDHDIWAKNYDRKLNDIFAIQSELSTSIANELKVSLTPHDEARLARRPTDNLAAYDLFLRYQDVVNRSSGTYRTESSIAERIELLSKAVDLDPKFALAWARLGAEYAYAYNYEFSIGIDNTSRKKEQAKHAIGRALELAPNDDEVRIAEGQFYLEAEQEFARAAQSFESVLGSAPNNVNALLALSGVRSEQDRQSDSVALLEKVLAIDSRNVGALSALSNIQLRFRRYDQALAVQRRMMNVRPNDIELQAKYYQSEYEKNGSWVAFDKWRSTLPPAAREGYSVWIGDIDRGWARRDFDEVLRQLATLPEGAKAEMGSYDIHILRALAFLAKGDRPRALDVSRAALKELASEPMRKRDQPGLVYYSGLFRAILGDREAAFEANRRAHVLALEGKNSRLAVYIFHNSLALHALLGDREQALQELSRQLKLPGSSVRSFLIDPMVASLWDDPSFQAILNDPTNNTPLPFELKDNLALEN